MRTLSRPRLASLDMFSSCLLATVGLAPALGCSSVLKEDDGEGGNGASQTTTTSASASTKAATSTGTTVTSATTADGTSVAASTSAGMNEPCVNPAPLIIGGQDTGFDVCEAGNLRRREVAECPAGMPNPNDCCGGCEPGYVCNTSGEVACFCQPACRSDSSCEPNEVCLCGEGGGLCVQATCHTAAECAPGQECTSWDPTNGCLYVGFACSTPADTCAGDLDCPPETPLCAVQPDGHRACNPGGCAIGRPFIVEGEVRRADIVARADWSTTCALPSLDALSSDLREELARSWEHTAQMEHASVAAFARFALQLLSLGAPADLLARTQRAMSDEIAHAKLAFALAAAYGGSPVGPAPLAIDGAMNEGNDVASIVRLVVREGCVGETVAALEAAELHERCEDPAPRRVLDRIADEETQHAELAWRTVKWALGAHGDVVSRVLAEELSAIELEIATPDPEAGPDDDRLGAHGVATPALRARFRRAALRKSIVPCLRAMLEDAARVAA